LKSMYTVYTEGVAIELCILHEQVRSKKISAFFSSLSTKMALIQEGN